MTRTRSGLQIGDDKDDKSAYPENEKLSQRGTHRDEGGQQQSVQSSHLEFPLFSPVQAPIRQSIGGYASAASSLDLEPELSPSASEIERDASDVEAAPGQRASASIVPLAAQGSQAVANSGPSVVQSGTQAFDSTQMAALTLTLQSIQQSMALMAATLSSSSEESSSRPSNATPLGHDRVERPREVTNGSQPAAPPAPTFAGLGYLAPAQMTLPTPTLTHKLGIRDHLDSVFEILLAMGLAVDDDFRPDPASRIIARNLVNDSLKNVPEVHRLVCDSGYRNLSWSQLKTWLVKEFASPHHVRLEMDAKLKALSYKRPCTVFTSAVREVYQLHRQFYLSNSDALRRLIERIVDIVPSPVSSFLISKLYSINADWHSAVPFAEGEGMTFMSLLEQRLASAEVADQFQKRQSPVLQVRERKPWLADWCKQFKGVLRCTGAGHREELEGLGSSEQFETKFFHRGRFGPYALVGYKTTPPTLTCSHKPFLMKEFKSSPPKN
jgi:hypothetical protein